MKDDIKYNPELEELMGLRKSFLDLCFERDRLRTELYEAQQALARKETPMSADIDEEEYGTADAAFDLENGWPDAALEQRLKDNNTGRPSTHFDGCWANHHGCTLGEILRLRAYIRTLDATPLPITDDDVTAWSWKDKYDGLFQSYQALEGELKQTEGAYDEMASEASRIEKERNEYRALYMNAFAAVRAMANLVVPEPKG